MYSTAVQYTLNIEMLPKGLQADFTIKPTNHPNFNPVTIHIVFFPYAEFGRTQLFTYDKRMGLFSPHESRDYVYAKKLHTLNLVG